LHFYFTSGCPAALMSFGKADNEKPTGGNEAQWNTSLI